MRSLSSRHMKYVSGDVARTPAAQNITFLFTGSRTFSAGSAAWCGHFRLRSSRVISFCGRHLAAREPVIRREESVAKV
jgi:hypothetical protein